jgi:predicted outer membrane protein
MNHRKFCIACLAPLGLSVMALSSHSQSSRPPQGTDRGAQTTTSPQAGDDRTAENSRMLTAIEMNVAEVEMAKIASRKAQHPRVKEFAEMMAKHHTQTLAKLRALPGGKVDVKPNAKHQHAAAQLSRLSGAQFDREYMAAMVSDHREALKFLEEQSGATHAKPAAPTAGTAEQGKASPGDLSSQRDATQPSVDSPGSRTDLSILAYELIPTVRTHFELAQEILKDVQSGADDRSNPAANPPK